MNKNLLLLESSESAIGLSFGKHDYDALTKDDVEEILETFPEEFITSGALGYILQNRSDILHLCRAWGWSDTPNRDEMYLILEGINAEDLMGG